MFRKIDNNDTKQINNTIEYLNNTIKWCKTLKNYLKKHNLGFVFTHYGLMTYEKADKLQVETETKLIKLP